MKNMSKPEKFTEVSKQTPTETVVKNPKQGAPKTRPAHQQPAKKS